jgi:ribose transport system ATP-binding protein
LSDGAVTQANATTRMSTTTLFEAQGLFRAQGLCKRYPGVVALQEVALRVGRGEVVALVGENGAGKSTLLKSIAGLVAPDAGDMTFDGAPWRPRDASAAARGGVALVHQELCLAENLTAAENIGLGREPQRFGLVDRRRLEERAAVALQRVGARFDPRVRVETLAAGERQLVEIAKGLDQAAKLLILDEPTSSLTARETAKLFELVKQLRSEGVSVLYVSHRLHEVLELADRAVVLRDGRNAGEFERRELSRDGLVARMVGRELAAVKHRPVVVREASRAPRVELRGVVTDAFPAASVELAAHAGELVGVAGLVGAGRTELLETLFGLRTRLGGEVLVDGQRVDVRGARAAVAAGIALVPEDRREQGLLLEESVRVNVALATLERRVRRGLVDAAAECAVADEAVRVLGVRAADREQEVATLSGGNQQKVVVGRWLASNPRLLLLDEPTRGVDVGAREELYVLLEKLAADGLCVVFASSDMEELLRLADRIVVMCDGRVTGELARHEATEERVLALATA